MIWDDTVSIIIFMILMVIIIVSWTNVIVDIRHGWHHIAFCNVCISWIPCWIFAVTPIVLLDIWVWKVLGAMCAELWHLNIWQFLLSTKSTCGRGYILQWSVEISLSTCITYNAIWQAGMCSCWFLDCIKSHIYGHTLCIILRCQIWLCYSKCLVILHHSTCWLHLLRFPLLQVAFSLH